MSLTLEQVENLLVAVNNEDSKAKSWRDHWDSVSDLEWSTIEDIFDYNGGKTFTTHGRTISGEDFDTGGEGHAEEVYMVFKTIDIDGAVQYWRKDGYYASYAGSEWDGDLREVELVERTVVFYE